MPFRLKDFIFCISNNNKENPTQYRQCGMHWFHQLWQIYCAHDACDQQRCQEMVISHVQFTTLHDGFKTYLLPSPRDRNSIKALGQKEKMSYQHTTALTAFPFVYAFQSILNQRDNKANRFQLSIYLCSDGCPVWCLQFIVS